MPRHTSTSTLQEVGQNLSDAMSFANIADAAAETFGADPKTRQNLKQAVIIGVLLAGGIYLLTKKK